MVTLGLIRALRNRGINVSSAKSGPDYIDPAFHCAASGKPCVNLDAWAMHAAQLRGLAHRQAGELLLVEGAMGLFDGALDVDDPYGKGSVADLAAVLNLPVLLVLDASKQAQTAAAIVAGMAGFRKGVNIAGVILNKIGSKRHQTMIAPAIEALGFPVLGAIPRSPDLVWPSRHLGLVQAQENTALEEFISKAGVLMENSLDLNQITDLATALQPAETPRFFKPLGQRISIARDAAFAFAYPHLLSAWQDAGAELSFFSPLADEIPHPQADAIYLPGGYPELYADQLAANSQFVQAMQQSRATIYGECGGYMVLGERLVDATGTAHQMLGLLPVSTSFAKKKMQLGYRRLTGIEGPFKGQTFKGHEFHYASVIEASNLGQLFSSSDSLTENRSFIGHVRDNVSGSFAHIIC